MENFELIKNFAGRLGIELEKSDDGTYHFNIDDRIFTILDLEECSRIVLVGDLGLPPPENKEKLYESLLEAQHMFASTAGATFSRDPKTGNLTLCKSLVPAVLDDDGFFADAENFINSLHLWADIIRDYRTTTVDSEDGPSPLSSGFMVV